MSSVTFFGTGGTEYGVIRAWVGSATTTDGVATVYPTDNGNVTGNAFFGTVLGAVCSTVVNTGNATSVPISGLKSVSTDKKTVQVNVVRGLAIAIPLLLNTLQFVPDGTEVSVIIFGIGPG